MANVMIIAVIIILVHSTTDATGPSATVYLRVEGAKETIFEAPISTEGHFVTTASGGTHICDGTNNHASLTPGPTATSALDSASKQAHFTWDGTFDQQYDDYFITRIGNSAQTTTQFWGILIGYNFIPVGGCQQKVKQGDNILFAFDAFNKAHFLKLESSQHTTTVGNPITVTVTDGKTGTPISDASVEDQTTDNNGRAYITFTSSGVKKLKAERSDSIRSNAIVIVVI